jgi:hypothetical protein
MLALASMRSLDICERREVSGVVERQGLKNVRKDWDKRHKGERNRQPVIRQKGKRVQR